jgi:hypothetical protein
MWALGLCRWLDLNWGMVWGPLRGERLLRAPHDIWRRSQERTCHLLGAPRIEPANPIAYHLLAEVSPWIPSSHHRYGPTFTCPIPTSVFSHGSAVNDSATVLGNARWEGAQLTTVPLTS